LGSGVSIRRHLKIGSVEIAYGTGEQRLEHQLDPFTAMGPAFQRPSMVHFIYVQDSRQRADAGLRSGTHRPIATPFRDRVSALMFHPTMERASLGASFADAGIGVGPQRKTAHAAEPVAAGQNPASASGGCKPQPQPWATKISKIATTGLGHLLDCLVDCCLGQPDRHIPAPWGFNGASPGLQ
jgi:hypothetical protein